METTNLKGGTDKYFSPEVIYNGKFCKESDIFSLGVIFFDLLVLKHDLKFYKLSHENKLNENLEQNLKKLKCNEYFYSMILNMLKFDPIKRLSVNNMIDLINNILKKEINKENFITISVKLYLNYRKLVKEVLVKFI
jgi:serine/threonine protein kinase